jgi:hypothetical protein
MVFKFFIDAADNPSQQLCALFNRFEFGHGTSLFCGSIKRRQVYPDAPEPGEISKDKIPARSSREQHRNRVKIVLLPPKAGVDRRVRSTKKGEWPDLPLPGMIS